MPGDARNHSIDSLTGVTGNSTSAARLLDAAYTELRRLAGAYVANLPPGQTLQATGLLHEAWLRLAAREGTEIQGRGHFLAAMAQVMRDVLVDEARRKAARKRGAGRDRISLSEADMEASTATSDLLELHEVLGRLEAEDPRAAKLVLLRYFGGLTEAETAEVLGLTVRTVQREWAFARAWLKRALSRGP